MLSLLLLFRAAAGLAPAPSTTSRTYLASLSPPAPAEAEAAAAPARRPRAAEALREKRAAEAPYLDGLDRRQWLTTAFARERGEAGRYLATLNERGAANKLDELRSREAATTDYYLEGLDRRGWTVTAFSQELARRERERRRESLTVARKPSMVTLVEDAAPVVTNPQPQDPAWALALKLTVLTTVAAYAMKYGELATPLPWRPTGLLRSAASVLGNLSLSPAVREQAHAVGGWKSLLLLGKSSDDGDDCYGAPRGSCSTYRTGYGQGRDA
mgnify:CR=1 FL=1